MVLIGSTKQLSQLLFRDISQKSSSKNYYWFKNFRYGTISFDEFKNEYQDFSTLKKYDAPTF